MKLKKFLPLLLILISFTACDETLFGRNIHPEYTIEKERLKSKVASIIPSEEIRITSSRSEIEGRSESHILHVEILSPGTFPLNSYSFSGLARNIQNTVEKNISNIEEFQKMEIVVRHTVEDNGTRLERNFIKEIDL